MEGGRGYSNLKIADNDRPFVNLFDRKGSSYHPIAYELVSLIPQVTISVLSKQEVMHSDMDV